MIYLMMRITVIVRFNVVKVKKMMLKYRKHKNLTEIYKRRYQRGYKRNHRASQVALVRIMKFLRQSGISL